MTCCDDIKHQRLYRAETPSGQAVWCLKCGRAHPATPSEIERIRATGGDA
ncbi:hypothetical protein SAMN05421774_11225 [Gemmobacter megaterium]|uniref:Uncharacterized protein n=1 Tax=Gemmobacter megaterium TaxID=1086013 RepID=A0A1N7QIJ8_9RHOB|nr:hypothetical protein [Gemmobacter megaterium]GGE26818.1 hypothetical protein GCM10011345_36020 [Gemmobacter megaterium]SIT22594.1 hypothetical protein SAMN05421774_11225 [Gemmobacter megaterium]